MSSDINVWDNIGEKNLDELSGKGGGLGLVEFSLQTAVHNDCVVKFGSMIGLTCSLHSVL